MNKPASILSKLMPEERLYQGAPLALNQVQELTFEFVEYAPASKRCEHLIGRLIVV